MRMWTACDVTKGVLHAVFQSDQGIATYFFFKDRLMAAANGEDSVPDAWDDNSGGAGDSEAQMNANLALKLNVNAPVFTPGQNVFAPAFQPFAPIQPNSDAPDSTTNTDNKGMNTNDGVYCRLLQWHKSVMRKLFNWVSVSTVSPHSVLKKFWLLLSSVMLHHHAQHVIWLYCICLT